MKATANLTKKDYKKFHWFAFFKYRKLHWFLIALWALYSTSIIINPPEDAVLRGYPVLYAITTSMVVMIALIILWPVIFFIVTHMPNRAKPVMGEHQWQIQDEWFSEKNSMTETRIKMDNLKLYITAKHYFLTQPNGVTFILPRVNLEADEGFLECLSQKVLKVIIC